ncbi:hypothetical protein A2U01_0114799, partial [Trifolium medium]|nr:hypothetical protein [Trifolium medium]
CDFVNTDGGEQDGGEKEGGGSVSCKCCDTE